MSAIQKWSEKRSVTVALTALTIAWSTDSLLNLLKTCREGPIQFDSCKAPTIDEWLSLYSDSGRIVKEIRMLVESSGNFAEKLVEFDDKTTEIKHKIKQINGNKPIPADLKSEARKHVLETMPELMEDHLQFLSKNLHGLDAPDSFGDRWMSQILEPFSMHSPKTEGSAI